MKMVSKISAAAIVLLMVALLSAPAFAQIGAGIGAYGAGGCGSCGGAVAYGAPQDCIAQISCNIPVTTQVPTVTTTTVPQQVPIVVPVTQSCPVQVPRVVVVPETVQVPYVTCAQSSTTVPVTVPVQTSVPVTNLVPQCYTVPLGCAGGEAVAAPSSISSCSPCAGMGTGIGTDIGIGSSGMATGMTGAADTTTTSGSSMPSAGLSSSQMSGLLSKIPSGTMSAPSK